MKHRRYWSITALAFAVVHPARAFAQADDSTILIAPAIPEGFDRDRNVSVTERPRPDYDPLGVRFGSIIVSPRVETGIGVSDNVYVTSTNRTADGFAYLSPSVSAASDWSRHFATVRAGAQLRRFFSQPRRNESAWNLGSLGRLDIGSSYSVTGELQLARLYESPLTGGIQSDFAVLSNYLRGYGALRGEYRSGQIRGVLAVDRTSFAFSDIKISNGTRIDQSDRDRILTRVTGQGEYALTPSLSVYGQVGYGRTDYSRPLLTGSPNRSSDAVRILGGFNFDLAGLLRGTLGVGYVRRSYDSALYKNVDGVSVEGRLEYFPSELTTVTLSVRRFIEDSSIGSTNAYFDNRLSVRVDHELLRNLLLNAQADVGRQTYIGIKQNATLYNLAGGARYLVSRKVNLLGSMSYTHRTNSNTGLLGQTFNEFRSQVGVVLSL